MVTEGDKVKTSGLQTSEKEAIQKMPEVDKEHGTVLEIDHIAE